MELINLKILNLTMEESKDIIYKEVLVLKNYCQL